MISFGTNIKKSIEEPMTPETLSAIAERIKNDSKLSDETEKLRLLKSIDKKAYQIRKTNLPYICTSVFKNGLRRKSNFLYASRMILDIDHCNQNISELKEKIICDPMVSLAFISPGGDGIKVILTFDKRITSEKKYKSIYQHIATEFGNKHDIYKYIDVKTHDPERVCFICHDSTVHINQNSQTVSTNISINTDTPEISFNQQNTFSASTILSDPSVLIILTDDELIALFDTFSATELLSLHNALENHPGKENFISVRKVLSSRLKKAPKPDPVEKDEMDQIRKKLNPNARIKAKPSYYVPEILNEVIPAIELKAKETGITLKEAHNISYGKKLLFTFKEKFAEVNLFYGKHGFKVVITSKRGYNHTLAEITELLIHNVLTLTDFESQSDEKELEELLKLLS
jgi:hypothetical protein